MAALQIQVRIGGKTKTIVLDGARISVGRSASASLVLPFDWVMQRHLVIENGEQALRIKLGSPDARARMGNRELTTEWTPLSSPARVDLQMPTGQLLRLDLTTVQAETGAAILRDHGDRDADAAPAPGNDELGVKMARAEGMGSGGWGMESAPGASGAVAAPTASESLSSISSSSLPEPGILVRAPRLIIGGYAGLFAVLILSALGFNQYRRAAERTRENNDATFVWERLREANEMVARKQYVSAKAALDAAEPVARSRTSLADAVEQIGRLRAKDEIKLGALGYVPVDGRWLPVETANAWRAARERDDPKIAKLEEAAAKALNEKRYDDARKACEQAIALMDAQPVKPHPRAEAVRAQLEIIKKDALAVEMTAKGYVWHDNRWITKEQQFALEQEAKGLVEYQGKWMTKTEMAAAQAKGGTGMVFHEGKWMTPEQKMQAEGYVQFEGEWMRPEKKQQLVDARQKEAERAKQEQVKVEATKQAAYTASQQAVRKQVAKPEKASFQAYGGPDVRVVYDDGWYIVKAQVEESAGARRTYYCKLKPGDKGDWEIDSTFFAN